MANIIDFNAVSVAANTTGFASNVTAASWTLAANNSGDSLAHLVTVHNDSITDHSAKTIALVGTGPNGQPQTETIAAPGISATVTSTKYFLTLTSATPSATIGADTFDIGWSASSVTAWKYPKDFKDHVSIGIGCIVTSGTPTFTVQHMYGDPSATAFSHSVIAAKSANTDGVYSDPIRGIRLAFTAAGGVHMIAIQSGV